MLRSIRYLMPLLALGLVAVLSQGLLAEDAPKTNTAVITGVITGADGKPVANARVTLQKPEAQESAQRADTPKPERNKARVRYKTLKHVQTDQDGKFTFDHVAAGSYRIVAGEKGAGMGRAEVTIEAGQTQTVNIQLKERKARDPK